MFKLLARLLQPNSDSALSEAAVLVLRLAAGLFIAGFHGWPKFLQGIAYLLHGDAWPLLEGITSFGLPFQTFWAFAATATYLISGLFVATGFLTRFAALDLLGVLLMAIYANSRVGGDNQLMMLYAAVFASFVLIGGGRIQLTQSCSGAQAAAIK